MHGVLEDGHQHSAEKPVADPAPGNQSYWHLGSAFSVSGTGRMFQAFELPSLWGLSG